MTHFKNFSDWLDSHLDKEIPSSVKAFCFNCYEGGDEPPTWDMELVGSSIFDKYDSDWPCDEVFNTRDDLLRIPQTKDILEWEDALTLMTSLVTEYLLHGKFADKLKEVQAVAIGFVDGDLDIVYQP